MKRRKLESINKRKLVLLSEVKYDSTSVSFLSLHVAIYLLN